MKLLLFDIDGTILLTNGAGTRAANRAFQKIYGLNDAMSRIDAAGKTDPLILSEMFMNCLSREYTSEEAQVLYRVYVEYLEEEIVKSPIDIMPGIPFLLEKLSVRKDIILGIATGNITILLAGAIPTALLAILFDALLGRLERALISPGLSIEK